MGYWSAAKAHAVKASKRTAVASACLFRSITKASDKNVRKRLTECRDVRRKKSECRSATADLRTSWFHTRSQVIVIPNLPTEGWQERDLTSACAENEVWLRNIESHQQRGILISRSWWSMRI